ncbi:MAG: class I SAM-dependent methyltransferase [Candidatus Rokubacteria bacterium]|nr:class I SAM-dependent methyltransferase [Candidatus Rokubacteria bacterium]
MPTFPETTRAMIRRWNRQARRYDMMVAPMERMLGLASARTQLFESLPNGRILEVGAGTGKNLVHHPPGAVVIPTDLSPGMLERLRRAAGGAPVVRRAVATDAEDLAFRDGSFDAVVGSCVFCTVPDPVRGLREVRRVLKDAGRLVLLEHVRPRGALGRLFDVLDPVMSRIMGPHINRRTVDNVRAAGFDVIAEHDVFSHWVKVIVARSRRADTTQQTTR